MSLRHSVPAFLTTALLLCGGAVAHAGDPVEEAQIAQAQGLLKRLEALHSAGKQDELEKAVARVPKAHNLLKSKALRGKLQSALGQLLADEDLAATRLTAVDALAQLNDPKGATRVLKPFLPTAKVEAAGPFALRVLQATGLLAEDGSLSMLLKLMEKAKDLNVSRYAIQALGKYGWSKRRVTVLKDMNEFLRKLRPGIVDPRLGKGGGAAARERYAFLRQSLVSSMNELTGQVIGTPEEWAATYKANKKALDKLFTFER